MKIVDLIIGVVTGIISGFGIGGGSILILYLTTIAGIEQHIASGINLLYFIGCAPTALIGHMVNKRIEWNVVIRCAAAGVLSAIPASLIAVELDTGLLRRLFGILLIYVGIKELLTGWTNKPK